MHLTLASTYFYGTPPSADQVELRFWLFIGLLSLPALVVYVVSKLESEDFKASLFSWVFWLSILLALVVPTVGPTPAVAPALAVFMLCSSAELLRYGWWEKTKGAVGVILGGFVLQGAVSSAFPHFMMTGRFF